MLYALYPQIGEILTPLYSDSFNAPTVTEAWSTTYLQSLRRQHGYKNKLHTA